MMLEIVGAVKEKAFQNGHELNLDQFEAIVKLVQQKY
jgi:hypothetical protein